MKTKVARGLVLHKPQLRALEFYQRARTVKAILYLLNRGHELERLIRWAAYKFETGRGKKFFYIQKSYEAQRDSLQGKLFILRIRFSWLYRLAQLLHRVGNLATVNPAYYAGSASGYGRKKHTANSAT